MAGEITPAATPPGLWPSPAENDWWYQVRGIATIEGRCDSSENDHRCKLVAGQKGPHADCCARNEPWDYPFVRQTPRGGSEPLSRKAMRRFVTPRGTILFFENLKPIGLIEITLSQSSMGSDSLCLLGGTFDRLHSGHHHLIMTCLENSDRLQIWLTSDEMAQSKDRYILDWQTRKQELIDWLVEIEQQDSVSIHLLEDNVGPAPTCLEATAIGCTPETHPTCESINSSRIEAGLKPLKIVEAEHKLSSDGKIISSSRIREGEITRTGNPWLGEGEMYIDQKMPAVLDDELKQPFGTLFEGPEERPEFAMKKALDSIPKNTPKIIAVGDVTVQTMLEMGEVPDIAFIDGMTKREAWEGADNLDRSKFHHLSTCINPPGLLTTDLKLATKVALTNSNSTLIVVSGEEDLAPIVVHLFAPLGCAVLYGQPGKGVVVRITSEVTKDNCRRLLDVFTREV